MKKILQLIFGILMTIAIITVTSFAVIEDVTSSVPGQSYTPGKYWELEQAYCEEKNATAVEYIGQSCGLFGCVDTQKTKCVSENREFRINYDRKEFCELMMKGDRGKC